MCGGTIGGLRCEIEVGRHVPLRVQVTFGIIASARRGGSKDSSNRQDRLSQA